MSLILLCILIVSIIAHEVAHGVAALWQGDITAKQAGRLTLNPIPHIDPIGSIVVPILCALSGSSIFFGWAKPVPINPYNFRNQKYGEALVAAAGPLTNIIIALVFSALIRIVPFSEGFTSIAQITILINIVLAFFNLLPIPPLDGSKILFTFIPGRNHQLKQWMENHIFISIIIAIALWRLLEPVLFMIANLLIGA